MREIWRSVVTLVHAPRGRAARDILAAFGLLQAVVRLLPLEGQLQPVNLLPSWLYGLLMLAGAVALLVTSDSCQRTRWAGRLVAAAGRGGGGRPVAAVGPGHLGRLAVLRGGRHPGRGGLQRGARR